MTCRLEYTVRASERYAFGKVKENEETMKLDDVKIMIGDKTYPVLDVNWIQTPGEYPHIEVSAVVRPQYTPYHTYATKSSPINPKPPFITKVIFNYPATIVFWSDKTKTVVKCGQNEERYDPEKGIAMAIAKKILGNNKSSYYNLFKPWLEKYDEQCAEEFETKKPEVIKKFNAFCDALFK